MSVQNEAKAKKIGVWNTDDKFIEKNTRSVTYFSDSGYSAARIMEDSKNIDKPLESIIEYVFSASFVTAYVHKF